MVIDISSIVKNVGAFIEFDITKELIELENISKSVDFDSKVRFNGSVTNINDIIVLNGKITASYRTICDRCGEPIQKNMNLGVCEDLLNEESTDINGDAFIDQYSFKGEELDLTKIIVDYLVLNVPMSHLCKVDCKGICPTCGKNLNYEDCGCNEDLPIDSRLSILKDYFKE